MNNILDTHKLNAKVWHTFTTDPTTGITLTTVDGVIVYINDQSTRIFFNKSIDPCLLVGKSLYDIGFSAEWAKERIDLFKQMKETGESVLLRTVWHGKQQFSWMSYIDSNSEHGEDPDKDDAIDRDCLCNRCGREGADALLDDNQGRVLVITRRVPATEETKYLLDGEHDTVKSTQIQLGKLGALTPRELEVLALMGQGMSIKEIAATLFRSVKTIENHRESIGRKLKKTRGVDLACIAHVAGLMVEDSTRHRESKD